MVICIEYWKGDAYLIGKTVSLPELKEQIRSIEKSYDPVEDNFVAMLCRVYGWEPTKNCVPEYTYDRDTSLYF
jgi:hypothetical protein